MLSGERSLYWKLTARENLEYFAALYHVPPSGMKARIETALAAVKLSDRADDYVERYSTGMRQRLALARALLPDPPLVILDEPTVGLDPQSSRDLRDRVRDLRSQGRTVLLTTHYMEEADQLCDRVAIIDHGRIVALDSPAALKRTIRAEEIVRLEIGSRVTARALLERLGRSATVARQERTNGTLAVTIALRVGARARARRVRRDAGSGGNRRAPRRGGAGDAGGRLPLADRSRAARMRLLVADLRAFVAAVRKELRTGAPLPDAVAGAGVLAGPVAGVLRADGTGVLRFGPAFDRGVRGTLGHDPVRRLRVRRLRDVHVALHDPVGAGHRAPDRADARKPRSRIPHSDISHGRALRSAGRGAADARHHVRGHGRGHVADLRRRPSARRRPAVARRRRVRAAVALRDRRAVRGGRAALRRDRTDRPAHPRRLGAHLRHHVPGPDAAGLGADAGVGAPADVHRAGHPRGAAPGSGTR